MSTELGTQATGSTVEETEGFDCRCVWRREEVAAGFVCAPEAHGIHTAPDRDVPSERHSRHAGDDYGAAEGDADGHLRVDGVLPIKGAIDDTSSRHKTPHNLPLGSGSEATMKATRGTFSVAFFTRTHRGFSV